VHDFLTQTVGLDVAKAGPPLRQGGFKFFGHLDLLAGDYSLRVLVRNGASGATGLRVVPVHVPAFAGGEPALLPPLFPEPPGRWLMVREEPRGEAKAPAYPFLLRSAPFVPASRPVLTPRRGTAGADRAIASWWPPDLQPGEYVLRVTVTGAAAEASSSVRFVIGPLG
jgi:hypothetical protein